MSDTIRILVAGAMLTATPVLAADSASEVARDAVQAIFVDFDVDAAKRLLADDYIQHNIGVPTGAAPILGFIPGLEESGIELTVHRTISEDDLVVFHVTYDNAQAFGADTLVGFDVYRVEDGQVAEHWDNLVPSAAPNPSGRTQTDGAADVVDRDGTAQNKALVTDFVDTVLKGGDASNITDFVSSEEYLQHNSAIADGLDGLGTASKAMADQGIELRYDTVHLVVAEGNFVFTASEGTFDGQPTAFFDLFRVADGRIVEHWDTITTIPPDEDMAHTNGKFGG